MSNTQAHAYESYEERELEKMWEDIKGRHLDNLNRSLLKTIAKNEYDVKTENISLHSKQMYDSKKGEWVPFDLWGAKDIINRDNETLRMRIYMPLLNQNEYGKTLMGWQSYNCSYLQESLKEKELHLLESIRPNQKAAKQLHNWLARKHTDEDGYDERVGY